MTGNAATYGVHVDAARPFMGFSEDDHIEGHRILSEMVTTTTRKAGGSRGSL